MGDECKTTEGLVLEIQRMSTEDGPGIRSTVFLKGCTLACEWCHNPESISPKPQLQWIDSRCIGCGLCIDTCENNALSQDEYGISINRDVCIGCGACAEQCPGTALELMGTRWTAEALAEELSKDRSYFDTSGGGVTLSGGEVAMQAVFARELLAKLRERDIHTAIDTCGNVGPQALERLLPLADLVLFDLKLMNFERHRQATGQGNEKIKENFALVCYHVREHRTFQRLWVRTPVIPGATDDEDNIRAIGEFLSGFDMAAISRWELCAFNNLCKDKYLRLGKRWKYADSPLMKTSRMKKLAAVAAASGVDPAIVHWSGSAISDEDACNNEDSPSLRLVKG